MAAARREVQSQVSVASSARDEAAGVKEATERSADEQRRALQQERDKTEKLAAELAEARSSLEAQAKAKAAEEVARDNQLAAMRGELQKAKAEATAAREFARGRAHPDPAGRAAVGVNSGKHGAARQPLAGGSVVYRRSTLNCGIFGAGSTAEGADRGCTAANEYGDAADNEPEQGSPQAVRLIARANLLLEQGNIGAARNMLDRAAEMGSTEALFWLAETYDPLLLSARQDLRYPERHRQGARTLRQGAGWRCE